MARSRLCRSCGDFHDIEATWPLDCIGHFGAIPNDAPYVRSDGMDPIKSMVSGKMHDSKSAYYAEVRRAGCEIVGNDRGGYGAPPQHNLPSVGESLKRTMQKNGML